MRVRRCATAVLPVLLLAGCAGTPAAAPVPSPTASSFVVHGSGTARPFDEYELQDLRRFAEGSGEPLEEVLDQQRGAAEFGELANALPEDPASGMVMAGRDIEHPGTAYMSFTRRPSSAVLEQLEALPIDTTVTFGLPLPHDELVRYSESLVGALDDVPGVQLVSCGPSDIGDAAELHYAVTGTAPAQEVLDAAVLQATRHWSVDGRLRLPVRFFVEAPQDGPGGLRPMNAAPTG